VILDHGNGEYSLLAHLRHGSVAVAAGARISAGDKVGECGNSGNTTEPHLHYHLQDTPVFGRAEGLPAQFTGYVADGRPVARGEPVRGQTIHP
jgi:murein DD-endopeptidase MepM/ murein hydrolase activator NlpD